MTKHVTVAPLWGKPVADPRLDVGTLAHLSPSTTDRIIGEMKADQEQYLRGKFTNPTPLVMDRRRRTVPRVRTHAPEFPVKVAMAVGAESAEPVPVQAARPAEEVLAGLHPAVRADVLRRSGGDVRRLRVLSPTSVIVLNRPSDE